MALNFVGITKKRVRFVPNVHSDEIPIKSGGSEIMMTGHDIIVPVSVTSGPHIIVGQAGQERTPPILEDSNPATNCNTGILCDIGQAGQTGQTFLDKDIEFFEERAAIIEYDGGLHREVAERQAYREIMQTTA